jgi:hypothetical protein
MFNRAWRVDRLMCCAVALSALLGEASVAQDTAPHSDPPLDTRGLTEIRNLSELPPELAETLGSHQDDQDRIADLERKPTAPIPRWVDRWFLLAGVGDNRALVAIEEQHGYGSSSRLHATSFALQGVHWVAGQEWILSSRPHTIGELAQLIQSPESHALTVQWQKKLQAVDTDRRRYWSAYHSPGPLRAVNINDEEVRQIEATVHDVFPGAIVTISGVTQGCACEDGPACTAQVSTAIYRQNTMHGLALSDINEHWVIGPVQQWYLDSAKLERTAFPNRAAYAAAREALDARFPTCAIGPQGGH